MANPKSRTTRTSARQQTKKNDSLQELNDTGLWTHQQIDDDVSVGVTGKRTTRNGGSRSTTAATATRSGTKRGAKKTKISSSINNNNSSFKQTISTLPHTLSHLSQSRYLSFIDPYRGIVPCFSISAGTYDGTDGKQGKCRGGMSGEEALMADCPWMRCADVLCESCCEWTFGDGGVEGGEGKGSIEIVNIDDDEDEKPVSKKNDNEEEEEETALLVQCGCPTVDKWATDEFEAFEKKRIAESKKKKKKKKGGKKKKSGESDDDAIMIDDDDDENDNENMAGSENAAENDMKSGGKKGPTLICGERKGDAKALYPCDYNPFCLASLGGIVDEYRHCIAKIRHDYTTDKNMETSDIEERLRHELMKTLKSPSQDNKGNGGENEDDGGLRRSILVDLDNIRAHVLHFIYDGTDEEDADITMRLHQINSCHQPLIFRPQNDQMSTPSATSTSISGSNNKMELSMPSGLRNLGATCYLNSQLQCLAQNLGFVHGLFSWRSPLLDSGSAADKRMATVLSNMQSILARMRYGPDRVICTNEFATALNLENNEMQDPNEFARLLFDRMGESFRRSTEISLGTPDENGLGNLLPSVFGGTTIYITKCSVCGCESRRSEDFMDISIPIVDVEEESSGSQLPGKSKRGNKSMAKNDVDVQQCLNKYLHPEMLEGDNQYECSTCEKKCNATRTCNFANLPPVLNIQLARYVFDIETLSKRKLQTNVLLPKTLEVPRDATDQNIPSKYILCAVQNHLGSSAHGGHYVADVMDWTTGVWYEFNDEDVEILENGPTSSFDPTEMEDDIEDQQGKKRKVSGSQDAYNLFYVEENYLSKQCGNELQHFMETESTKDNSALSDDTNVLTSVKVQRMERYRLELENQTKKRLKGERITYRREQIIQKLLLPASQLAIVAGKNDHVWVDSTFLRRFFASQDGMDDLFHSAHESFTLLRSQTFLCDHSKGLNPIVARTGKMLPPKVYDALETIVQEEYLMFRRHQGNLPDVLSSPKLSLSDCKFVESINLTCDDCGLKYQEETRQNYELLTTLLSIYDDLVAGKNDLDRNSDLDTSNTYAISRTWITSFRKYLEKKVNELKPTPSKKSVDEAKNTPCGGIDTLDLSEISKLDNVKLERSEERSDDSTEPTDPFKGEDPTSKISCEHGCCPLMGSAKSVRLIPGEVWQTIAKVFPQALAHRFEYQYEGAVGNCVECYVEKEREKLFPQRLHDWKSAIEQPGSLNDLLKRGKQASQMYPAEQLEVGLQHSDGPLTLRVLHHIDVQRWRDSFGVAEKSARKKNDTIKRKLNDLLFIESELFGREWKFRPLSCKEHGMAIGLPSISDQEDVNCWLGKLGEANVELLLENEYDELIRSLSAMESILHGDESAAFPTKKMPTVTISVQDGMSNIVVCPPNCTNGCGVTSFSGESIEEGEVITIKDEPQSAKKKPIDESPTGPLCKIIVHEVDNGNNIDVAASLIQVEESNENTQSSASGRPRRTRRARGGAGGFPIYEVEMALDGNLAHFRLLLLQMKHKKLYGQRLFLLQSTEELPRSSDQKTLHEIVLGLSSMDTGSAELEQHCTLHLILSYNDDSDETKPNSRKRVSRQEEKEEEDRLLTSLTEIACGGWKTADENDVVIGGKKSKRPRQERGFQGTFLQSAEFEIPENPPVDHDIPQTVMQLDESEDTVQHEGDSRDVFLIDSTPKKMINSNSGIEMDDYDDGKDIQPGVSEVIVDDMQGTSDECSAPTLATQENDDTHTTNPASDTISTKMTDLSCHGCDRGWDSNFEVCNACMVVRYCSECLEDKLPVHRRTCSGHLVSTRDKAPRSRD